MINKTFLITVFLIFAIGSVNAQSLTIEECYQMAKANYPAIKKMDLIAETSDYDLKNVNKKFLPQLNISGQATYQSETVGFGDAIGALPGGIELPSLSKDQYKIQGEINQLLYDGGSNASQKELIKANKELQEQNLEANLYAINSRINNIFFSVLLMDAQLKQNEINKANLQTQIQKTEAAFENGVAFKSNVDELKAEIVNIEMAGTEYQSNRTAFLKMLSMFIGREIGNATQLEIPRTEFLNTSINRPELKAFELQKSVFEVQKKDLRSSYLPQLSAFFQGGYGRPTLNIIENEFGGWYMTGIRLNWSLGSLYTLSNRKNTLALNQQSVDADKETFLFNTRLDLAQQDENVKKYIELIRKDEEAIVLRTSVTKSAEAQLNNGVITTHEYIQKLNAEHLTRQNKILHEVQLLQAKYNQKFITGN
ncbi:TolC family protein [Sphingobacterium sp. UBA5670]|uniref:TolC family protein n=1 Tax=Sphingobacterium sp. UBA5670 TaxID=1947502 RepID=UPI0025FF7C7D|nr:TolC family protein [Sphingobacterium sp. UBA5670]